MEIIFLVLAVGALVLGHKLGRDQGRLETLESLNQRIVDGLEPTTDFSRKHGIRGTHLTLDYFGSDAKLGTGYHPVPHVEFVLIHGDDFKNLMKNM